MMDTVAEELARHLIDRIQSHSPTSRLLIGLAGIPASGKSTLALLVVNRVNGLLGHTPEPAASSEGSSNNSQAAILVGLDGWHLTRAQLDALPDPKLAHDRRGAHWTFDGPAYVEFVKQLRGPIAPETGVVRAPSFDHAVKDPVPENVLIYPYHRIVLIEGLYTFLSIEPWKFAGNLLDERWFIEVNAETAANRLVQRHVATGVAKDMLEALWRSKENDMPNGLFVLANMLKPTRTINSIEDPIFATEH